MEKTVILEQTEISPGKCVICHFRAIVTDNGKIIGRSDSPHTVSFMPDANHEALFIEVNNDITTRPSLMWPPIPESEWKRAVDHCGIEHTDEIKQQFRNFLVLNAIVDDRIKTSE